jgi:hypothetical protein
MRFLTFSGEEILNALRNTLYRVLIYKLFNSAVLNVEINEIRISRILIRYYGELMFQNSVLRAFVFTHTTEFIS